MWKEAWLVADLVCGVGVLYLLMLCALIVAWHQIQQIQGNTKSGKQLYHKEVCQRDGGSCTKQWAKASKG